MFQPSKGFQKGAEKNRKKYILKAAVSVAGVTEKAEGGDVENSGDVPALLLSNNGIFWCTPKSLPVVCRRRNVERTLSFKCKGLPSSLVAAAA